MLQITFASHNCNNHKTACQSAYFTNQNIFKPDGELQESLDGNSESLNNLFESFTDVVTNNIDHEFFSSSSDTKNKYMFAKQILRYCINRCFISFYFIGCQNCKLGICFSFCVNIMLLFILVAYFWLFCLKCKAVYYFVNTFYFTFFEF